MFALIELRLDFITRISGAPLAHERGVGAWTQRPVVSYDPWCDVIHVYVTRTRVIFFGFGLYSCICAHADGCVAIECRVYGLSGVTCSQLFPFLLVCAMDWPPCAPLAPVLHSPL